MRTWPVVAVLLLGLYGCGGDDGDDDGKEDAGNDAGHDAGGDAGGDAGHPADGGGGSTDGGASDASTGPSADAGSSTDAGMDGGGGNIDGGLADAGESFDKLYSEIFMTRCGPCHSSLDGGHKSGGLSLVPKDLSQLIDIHSTGACADAGFIRVVKGQPDMSLLLLKLEPNPPCGQRMPRAIGDASAMYLDDAEVERVRRWIEEGANNN